MHVKFSRKIKSLVLTAKVAGAWVQISTCARALRLSSSASIYYKVSHFRNVSHHNNSITKRMRSGMDRQTLTALNMPGYLKNNAGFSSLLFVINAIGDIFVKAIIGSETVRPCQRNFTERRRQNRRSMISC